MRTVLLVAVWSAVGCSILAMLVRQLRQRRDARSLLTTLARGSAMSSAPSAPDCPCSEQRPRGNYRGHLVCSVCRALYTTHDPALSTHAPDDCPCGVRLRPGRRWMGRVWTHRDYSARVCCLECVLGRLQERAGMVMPAGA